MLKDIFTSASGRDVICRELTVTEIRDLLTAPVTDHVDALVLEETSLSELAAMCDLSLDDMAGMAPSELTRLAEKVKGVNPGFFGLKARIEKLIRGAG